MLKPIWKTDQKARHVFGSKPEDLVLMQVAKLFTPLCHVLSLYYPSEGNNLSTLSNAADLPMRVSSLGSTNLEGKKLNQSIQQCPEDRGRNGKPN